MAASVASNLSVVDGDFSAFDWQGISDDLGARGYAVIPALLKREQCADLVELYADKDLFGAGSS